MIDLKTYNKATILFNKYLLRNDTNIYTLSNPVLSIINEHSTNTRLLKNDFQKNSLIIFVKFYFFTFPVLVLFFLLNKIFSKKININFKTNTLVFSHLIDLTYFDKNQDYIFGNIFKNNKKDISFVYLSALKSHQKNTQLKNKKFNYKHIILDEDYKYIELKNLFNIFKNCLIERSKLLNEAKKKNNIDEKRLLFLSADFSLSRSSIINLIRFFTISKIIRGPNPKYINNF